MTFDRYTFSWRSLTWETLKKIFFLKFFKDFTDHKNDIVNIPLLKHICNISKCVYRSGYRFMLDVVDDDDDGLHKMYLKKYILGFTFVLCIYSNFWFTSRFYSNAKCSIQL